MRPQSIPPPSQIEVEAELRDQFKHGDITAVSIWLGHRDHTTLSRELNSEEPAESSAYAFLRFLDACYKTRFELGTAVWALVERFNARYQQKAVETQTFSPVAETFHTLNIAELNDLPVRDRLRVAQQLYSDLGKYIAGLYHLDMDADEEETQYPRPAKTAGGR